MDDFAIIRQFKLGYVPKGSPKSRVHWRITKMYLSNDQLQMQGDPPKDRQLEIEIQAFAELLLDIYEYRHQQKLRQTNPRSQFDDVFKQRKME